MFKETHKCHGPRRTIWKTRVRNNRNGTNSKNIKEESSRQTKQRPCGITTTFPKWEFWWARAREASGSVLQSRLVVSEGVGKCTEWRPWEIKLQNSEFGKETSKLPLSTSAVDVAKGFVTEIKIKGSLHFQKEAETDPKVQKASYHQHLLRLCKWVSRRFLRALWEGSNYQRHVGYLRITALK